MIQDTLLPETGFVRLPIVLKVIPVGKSTWWEGVRSGRFPKPVKLGPRTTAWRVEEIVDLIQHYQSQKPKQASPVSNHPKSPVEA